MTDKTNQVHISPLTTHMERVPLKSILRYYNSHEANTTKTQQADLKKKIVIVQQNYIFWLDNNKLETLHRGYFGYFKFLHK